jgi:SAM-dependent methyltransferase
MTRQFEFEENDAVGEDTLDVISDADAFNGWMYNSIKPFLKGRVVEIGSGIGNISQFVLNDGFELMTTDIREGYCQRLKAKLSGFKSSLGSQQIDLTDPNFDENHQNLLGTFDSFFALNVVEHIEDDNLAIVNAKKLLKPSGHLIVLVPSYQFLYNGFDEELGHFRRYTVSSLKNLFVKNNLEIIHKQYFNFAGIGGWFVSGNMLGNRNIPEGQMSFYNSLVPLFKIADKIVLNKIGLSSIVVGKKVD